MHPHLVRCWPFCCMLKHMLRHCAQVAVVLTPHGRRSGAGGGEGGRDISLHLSGTVSHISIMC